MSPTFETLGVAADFVDALARDGITEPFPIQALTIPDALAGRDLCGKAKTGSGKTLAFGLPLLERIGRAEPKTPRALVLTPTRELANQVKNVLAPLGKVRGVRVSAVYGGASMDRQITALRKGVDAVVGTPGRLIDLLERRELSLRAVEILVVDEADRMADLGFMPQVQKLLHRIESEHQTMLFSATLDGGVRQLVNRYMHDPVKHEVESPEATVDEMTHRFLHVHQMDKVKVAAAISRGVAAAWSARSSSCGPSAAPTALSLSFAVRVCAPGPSTAISGRARASGLWPTSPVESSPFSLPPTSQRAAFTSTTSTWSSTTTRPKTRRRTCTGRVARRVPARPASR